MPLSTRLPPLVATNIVRLVDVTIRTTSYNALAVGVPDRPPHKELVPMSRPLTALASLVLTALGGVLLLPPQCASACQCTMLPGSLNAERALADSEAVFSGEVVKIDRPSPFKSGADLETDTFRVYEVWKGPEQRTLEVHTALMGASCGYPFKEGQEYLVYAYTGKRGLEVDLCNGTQPLSEAEANLGVLGAGKKPTGGGVLSDTSGGVSGRAMVGLAGLALAASVLVVSRVVRSG
jgi:hypothetical protein